MPERRPALLVLAPMALEARLVSSAGLRVRRTGIGPRRAQAAGADLRREAPDALVVVMGLAGGLTAGLAAGEVVIADEVRGSGGERVVCPAADLLAHALRDGGVQARRAVLASSSRPVLGRARARVRLATGALVADMESLWVLEAAGAELFGVVRVVADAPRAGARMPWLAPGRFLAASRALQRAAVALAAWSGADGAGRAEDALGFDRSPRVEGASAPHHGAG